ncbi:MAG: adenosylcobinamide amidohydrolase, partial [Desulfobacterales bacterium]
MLIGNYYNGVEIHREDKMVYAKFLCPHRVISTCKVNGGLRDDLEYIINHQSCEPNGHYRKRLRLAINHP